ncbi:hypothetical protein [Yersinia intermedia]|uniref:hypothetical protein n=1 Tax=Yersinia intermedia TaxID=631 RepID=UPI003F9FD40E
MNSAACQKEAFPLAGLLSQLGTGNAWNLSKPDIESAIARSSTHINEGFIGVTTRGGEGFLGVTTRERKDFMQQYAHAVEPLESIKKGSISAALWRVASGSQLLGSIPSLRNLSRQESLTHELKFPSPATAFICSSSESSKRMCFIVLPLRSNAFFSFSSCIGSYQYYNGNMNGNYHFIANQYYSVKTAKPGSGGTLTGPLTTNVNACNEVAMLNHTPTRFKFLFLAVCRSDLNAKPHRESERADHEI